MAADLFEGCWHRIRRARTHREAATAAWNAFLNEEPYYPSLNVDDDGNGSLWIMQSAPIPHDIPLLLGEWLYCLRSALDNCIYAVAVRDTDSDPPPGEDVIQFPIYDTPEAFRRNKYRINPLSREHREWLETVQPYANGTDPKDTILYWLNHLGRRDRHRQLHVVGAYVSESTPVVRVPAPSAVLFEDVDPYVTIDYEAEIARFQIVPPCPRDQVNANPQTALEPDIADMARERPERDSWLYMPLTKRLFFIEGYVDATVGYFEFDAYGWTRSKFFEKPTDVDGE
jgi:hypothetical protein